MKLNWVNVKLEKILRYLLLSKLDKYLGEIRTLSLSNDTVANRIYKISNDQFEQLITKLKENLML